MKADAPRSRFAGQAAAKSAGVVIGVVQKVLPQQQTPEYTIEHQHVENELQRLHKSVAKASASIQAEIKAMRAEQSSDDVILILEVHRMMLHDPELVGSAEALILHGCINAEWALKKVLTQLVDNFSQIKDEYLRSRTVDIEHVGQRILANLADEKASESRAHPIMVAIDFSPSDIVNMWRERAVGFVSAQGGSDSHAMIVARGVGLTGLAGVPDLFDWVENGDTIIIDAEQGCWILNPEDAELKQYINLQQSIAQVQQGLRSYVNKPSVSKSGYAMPLMANLEFSEEVGLANSFGVDGVGLFRTEFLFIESASLPDENRQYQHYQQVVRSMDGKPVTLRLLDVGADKVSAFIEQLGMDETENPALGLRGVRLLLHHPELLEPQLRAIIKASLLGPVQILIPMVTLVEEVQVVRALLDQLKADLGVSSDIPLGCMIEVPAAALIADDLATVSDFFSIGSNDLMQYCLAVDRADEHVSHLYDAEHPAIKSMIKMVVQAAHRADTPVSLCGELAANPLWTQFFLDIKMTSLSMSSRCVLAVRKQLQALS